MSQDRIPIADPAAENAELSGELEAAVKRVLASGRYILGPEGAALEAALAAYTGAAHAVGCNSGTDALHLALRAADIGSGDEVIMPAFTFVATAEAASYVGARPVFVDIDPATFCMDPKSVERALTPRTRALIAVHLYGQTAPLAELAALCRDRGITLVEDCAQSLGAEEAGRGSGSWGAFGCFSFYPTKN
ncbi:MAG: aminotransferase class I/II-fold pyridoxal phosphate-dependent enzyme, partial [Proteobacteria bacterium]|nr:aminotransferase class I/II-fold pyridoxal phosphate-dependent enzyme [Pseudomonadota bacterium]